MCFVLFQPVHIPLFRRRVFCSGAAVVWKQLGVETEGVPAKQFIVAKGRRGAVALRLHGNKWCGDAAVHVVT